MADRKRRIRPSILLAVIAAVVVLAAVFSHGIRVRLIWGGSGLLAGIICGVLITLEVQHRRRNPRK